MYNEEKKGKRTKKKVKAQKRSFFNNNLGDSQGFISDIEKSFQKVMTWQVIISIIAILIGIIFYFYTEASTTFISIITGILFIAIGTYQLLSYPKRKIIPLFNWHLYYGIAGIILGIVAIINPFIFTKATTVLVGLWLVSISVTKLELALRLKVISEKCWLYLLISGCLSLFMGIVLMFNPFNNLLLTEIIGSFLILYGILDISDVFMLKKRANSFLENF